MTTAPEVAPEVERWQEFAARPARYAHPQRIVSCFGGRFGVDLCERLRTCRRLEIRLSGLLCTHYQLAPWIAAETCESPDRPIALASAGQLADLAQRCGAIYCSSVIADVILGHQVAALQAQLGEALCTFALAHRDLAGPVESIGPPADLGTRVTETGWYCIGAWCHAQPEEIGIRVRLKLAPSPALDAVPEERFIRPGCAIVRRAAA